MSEIVVDSSVVAKWILPDYTPDKHSEERTHDDQNDSGQSAWPAH
jgi:hypothetical protein